MRLPKSAHTSRPWRIHELTGDFAVEDVWALPTPGGPDDFPRLVERFARADPAQGSRMVKALFALRFKLGELLGWDRAEDGLGARVASLRDRLPDDLRGTAPDEEFAALPFRPLFLTRDEFAAEIANRTVHGVLHLGWVPDGDGYTGRLAVLVKPNGLGGRLYLAGIAPFRHLLVYPLLLRRVGRQWRASGAGDR